jgi:rhodanese-related sulfurtransferase
MMKTFLSIFIISVFVVSLHAQKKFYTCHEITADEFHAWYLSVPNIIIFDIRDDSAFLKKHIPNAISAKTDSLLVSLSDTLDADQKIIVYDQQGDESVDACLLLAARGKNSVYHLKGGLLEWERLNFSIKNPGK